MTFSETTKDDIQILKQQLADVTAQINRMAKNAGRDIKDEAEPHWQATRDYIFKTAEDLKTRGQEFAHKADEAKQKTNKYVHEHPWQAILGGVAAGIILGSMFRNRRE